MREPSILQKSPVARNLLISGYGSILMAGYLLLYQPNQPLSPDLWPAPRGAVGGAMLFLGGMAVILGKVEEFTDSE